MSEMQWLVDMLSPYCDSYQIGWAVVVIVVALVLSVLRFFTYALFPKR